MKESLDKMAAERTKLNKVDLEKKAEGYCHKVKPLMDAIRDHADALEKVVDDETWPLPKMREILFTR
jgi:glutamine synthetase